MHKGWSCLYVCPSVCPVHQKLCTFESWVKFFVSITPTKLYPELQSKVIHRIQTVWTCAWRKVMPVCLSLCLSYMSNVVHRWLFCQIPCKHNSCQNGFLISRIPCKHNCQNGFLISRISCESLPAFNMHSIYIKTKEIAMLCLNSNVTCKGQGHKDQGQNAADTRVQGARIYSLQSAF